MDEGLTIESFAEQMAQADKPEQPPADSGPDDPLLPDEGQATDEAEPEAQAEGEQSEQPETDSEPEERVIKWTTANGESFEATESELKAGYLRQQDYTQKTQAVAEQARQSQAEVQKQAQQYMAAVAQFNEGLAYVGGLKAQIQSLKAQGMDAAGLEVQLMRAENQLGNAFAQFTHNLTAQEQAQMQADVSEAEAHLTSKFPTIKREDMVRVFENVNKLKASQKEIDLIRTNKHLAELAVYASKYLDLQAKKPEVANKVKKLPPTTTAARPATPSTKTDAVLKAINSRRTFSTAEFGQLLRAAK
mgnify:CR=1 FL=1